MQDSDRRNSSQPRRASVERDFSSMDERVEESYVEERPNKALPRRGWISALIIGLVGGIIALIFPITAVLINTPLYREIARQDPNTPSQIGFIIAAWQCSALFVDLLLAFFVGVIARKIAVKRRWGCLAGILVGGIVFLGIFFVHYFPGYPEIIHSSGDPSAGTWFAIGLFIVWSLVGGLMGVLGALIAKPRYH